MVKASHTSEIESNPPTWLRGAQGFIRSDGTRVMLCWVYDESSNREKAHSWKIWNQDFEVFRPCDDIALPDLLKWVDETFPLPPP